MTYNQKFGVLVFVQLVFLVGLVLGAGGKSDSASMGRMIAAQPVCYAVTEDSDITGCDYRNGAWYRK